MFQILLCTLPNLNLIQQIWSNYFDCVLAKIYQSLIGLNNCYFRFFKDSFGKHFFKNLYFSQSFCLFCVISSYLFQKKFFFYFQWSLSFHCLLWFSHAVIFWTPGFYSIGCVLLIITSRAVVDPHHLKVEVAD